MNTDLSSPFFDPFIQQANTDETNNESLIRGLRIDTRTNANTASRVSPQVSTLISPSEKISPFNTSPVHEHEEQPLPEIKEEIQGLKDNDTPDTNRSTAIIIPEEIESDIEEEITASQFAQLSTFGAPDAQLSETIEENLECSGKSFKNEIIAHNPYASELNAHSVTLSDNESDYMDESFYSDTSEFEDQTTQYHPSTPRQLGLKSEQGQKNLTFLGRGSFGEASKVKNENTVIKVHHELKAITLAREAVNIAVDELLRGTQENNIAISRNHFQGTPLVTSSPYKGQPLLSARKKLSLNEAIRAALPEAKDIARVHQMGLSCGDIKTDNTLYQHGRLQGIDRAHNVLESNTNIQKSISEKAMDLFNKTVGQYQEGKKFKSQMPAAITHALTKPVDTVTYQPPEAPESGKEYDLAKREVYSFAMTMMEFLAGERIQFRSDGVPFTNCLMPQIPILCRMISTTDIDLKVNTKDGSDPDQLTFDFKTVKNGSSPTDSQYTLEIRLQSTITDTAAGQKIVGLLRDMTRFEPANRIDMLTVVQRLSDICEL